MRKTIIFCQIIFCFFIAACDSSENTSEVPPPAPMTETVEAIATLDPCLAPALNDEVAKINKLMREFDDYSTLASNTPQTQLVVIIPELQRILREAEDQVVPSCLLSLKKLQLEHMEIVVQTLLAFIGNSDPNLVNTGISRARDLHQQYDIELARLLGITLQISTAPATTLETSSPPTSSPTSILTNPGPNKINLWSAPSFDAPVSGVLAVQATANAVGRTADNQWIQVEIPGQSGQTAWVIASVAQLSVPIEQLLVVTP